jgi:hypothetical protein
MSLKILHMADIHARDKDLDEINRCMTTIIGTARAEKPDLIVIAGDIFDSRDIKTESETSLFIIGCMCILANIAPIAIVTGTPSHDGNAPRILESVRGVFPVKVVSAPEQIHLYASEFRAAEPYGIPNAVLTLIPTPTKQYLQGSDGDITQAMSGLFAGFGAQAAEYKCPHILVTHLNIGGSKLPNGYVRVGMDIEVSIDQMNLGNFDLGCLGHIHINQCLGGKYFYSGPIYATKIDEDGPKGFYIHERHSICAEAGHYEWESRFIETPAKKVIRFQENFTDGTSDIRSLTFPQAPIRIDEFIGALVRLDYTVWQDEANLIDKDDVIAFYAGSGAADVDIRIIRIPRENIRAESVLKAETLRDKISKMAELRGEEVNGNTFEKCDVLETMTADEIVGRIAI